MKRQLSWNLLKFGWGLGTLLLLSGCGERSPAHDGICVGDKPHAYTKPPLINSCEEIRTNESAKDPVTGKTEHIHRFFHCCP